MTEIDKLPNDGFFIIIVYFRENKENIQNDTRRLLMPNNKTQSLVKYLKDKFKKDMEVAHHFFALIKNPPGGKKISRALGAVEIIRYKCDNFEQVRKLYEEIKRWCEKKGWDYEIMFADWIIERGENYG